MRSKNTILLTVVVTLNLIALLGNTATAQISAFNEERRGCLYFGVGTGVYTSYGHSTVHIDQGSLGNNYQMNGLAATNSGTGASFSPLQLDYRLGYFFTYDQKWGAELSYDGNPYYVTDNQKVIIGGTVNGIKQSSTVTFSAANGFKYSLNGADLILINAVRRFGLFWGGTHKVRLDAFLKVGVGPAMPKPTVSLYGDPNSPKMGFGGWNTGVEAAFRATLFRYGYLEIAAKYDYASLSGMNITDGTAKQNLAITSVIASIGFTIPTTHEHPLFEKGEKKHRVITLKPMYPSDTN